MANTRGTYRIKGKYEITYRTQDIRTENTTQKKETEKRGKQTIRNIFGPDK